MVPYDGSLCVLVGEGGMVNTDVTDAVEGLQRCFWQLQQWCVGVTNPSAQYQLPIILSTVLVTR
jgi:hypothetical protein